jgi:ABC-type multidrug transport system permease subunit
MRIKKLLKRFVATPMSRLHFLMASAISRLIILLPEVALQLSFAYFFFGVKNHGSWPFLIFLVIFGMVVFASIGLLAASRVKTIDGISGIMNLTMLPMWILSGVFFSSENYPGYLQPFIKSLPLTAVNTALRGVMQDGLGPTQLWFELLVMIAWVVVSLPIALKIFRWQ